jgi:PKD repeat protein
MERKLMMHRLTTSAVVVLAMTTAACTIKDTQPPDWSGPSEMALSLLLSASPEVLSLDGASRSTIRVEARDENGQLKSGVRMRVDTVVDGATMDFGSLSAREIQTGSNGQAEVVYTAPMFLAGEIPSLSISVTPTGVNAANDAANLIRRVVSIRLVPPGVIGNAPTANFTFTPQNPGAFETVRFDGSTSVPGLGAIITNYVWDFGDNTSGTGVTASHQYSAQGTYFVRLTVTDSNGFSGTSAAQVITVGAGSGPTADFIFSPTAPSINATVFFNGTVSTAGVGHRLVRYEWDFGDGTRRTGSTVSHAYSTAGTYNVLLRVTDEVGQTAQVSRSVIVGASPAVAVFTYSPTNPNTSTTIAFNGSASKGEGTNSIAQYAWDFGCTAGTNCTTAAVSSATPTTSNRYTAAGTYTVRLTITDTQGRTATTTLSVTVTP